jgi:hypothetical protein
MPPPPSTIAQALARFLEGDESLLNSLDEAAADAVSSIRRVKALFLSIFLFLVPYCSIGRLS